MLILKPDLTDNNSTTRVFAFKNLICSIHVLILCFGLLLHPLLSPNHKVSNISASRLPVTTELQLQALWNMSDIANFTNTNNLTIALKTISTKAETKPGSAQEMCLKVGDDAGVAHFLLNQHLAFCTVFPVSVCSFIHFISF